MKNMKRRDFINSLNALTWISLYGSVPGMSLIPNWASADTDESKRKFFVMIRVPLGWDVTLGLDPKVHHNGSTQKDMFIEYRPEDIFTFDRLSLAPACLPLKDHMADIAVINGVFMSDTNVSHESNRDYISTGSSSGGSADLPVEIGYASAYGPFGIMFGSTLKRADRAVDSSLISSLDDLRTAANIDSLQNFVEGMHTPTALRLAQLKMISNRAARMRLIAAMDSLNSEINPTSSGYNSNSRVSGGGARTFGLLAAAFKSRSSYQAALDLNIDLDTHSQHEGAHLKNQIAVWQEIADLFKLFKRVELTDAQGKSQGSLFANTTFMVVSEFSRTPALNASLGKDHNPYTNSVLLAGAGVRGGLSMGHSQLILCKNSPDGEPRHISGLVDYTTGDIAETKEQARQSRFQYIFPENVAATVADVLGADRSRFASVSPEVASIRLVKKS